MNIIMHLQTVLQVKAKYTVIISKIKTYIKNKLKKDWSPEQIVGRS